MILGIFWIREISVDKNWIVRSIPLTLEIPRILFEKAMELDLPSRPDAPLPASTAKAATSSQRSATARSPSRSAGSAAAFPPASSRSRSIGYTSVLLSIRR